MTAALSFPPPAIDWRSVAPEDWAFLADLIDTPALPVPASPLALVDKAPPATLNEPAAVRGVDPIIVLRAWFAARREPEREFLIRKAVCQCAHCRALPSTCAYCSQLPDVVDDPRPALGKGEKCEVREPHEASRYPELPETIWLVALGLVQDEKQIAKLERMARKYISAPPLPDRKEKQEAPPVFRMPKPRVDLDPKKLGAVRAQIEQKVSQVKIPKLLKLGSAKDYRDELTAQTAAEFFAPGRKFKQANTVTRAFERAKKQLAKLHRELGVENPEKAKIVLTMAAKTSADVPIYFERLK